MTGGLVHLTEGGFDISATLDLDGDNESISGRGESTVLTPSGALAPMISILGAGTGSTDHVEGITLSSFRIDHDRSAAVEAIWMKWAHNIRLKDVTISDIQGHALKCVEVWDSWFTRCGFLSSGVAGTTQAMVRLEAETARCAGLHFEGCWFENWYYDCMQINEANTIFVVFCKLHSSQAAQKTIVYSGDWPTDSHINICAFECKAGVTATSHIELGSTARRADIVGNTFFQAVDAILVSTTSNHGNVINSNHFWTCTDGIHLASNFYGEITGNFFDTGTVTNPINRAVAQTNGRIQNNRGDQSRLDEGQGADVGSANDLTLGEDGHTFEITGAVQINRIVNTGWVNGQEITLLFTANPVVKDAQASGGANITMLLSGGVDFNTAAGDSLKLVLSEIGGTQAWREVSRTVV